MNLLYQVNDFYVEVLYDGKENRVKAVRSFRQCVYLEAYLKQMIYQGLGEPILQWLHLSANGYFIIYLGDHTHRSLGILW
jgi:UTP-glucose-1-phosphate uridylyltransferase